jgi:hypothetical protein
MKITSLADADFNHGLVKGLLVAGPQWTFVGRLLRGSGTEVTLKYSLSPLPRDGSSLLTTGRPCRARSENSSKQEPVLECSSFPKSWTFLRLSKLCFWFGLLPTPKSGPTESARFRFRCVNRRSVCWRSHGAVAAKFSGRPYQS